MIRRVLALARCAWRRGCRPAPLAALVCVLLGPGRAPAQPADEGIKEYVDLPADTAENSLKRFSEQLRFELVFPTDEVAGVRTGAVRGEMTAREALDRILAGTGLTVVEDANTGLLTIRRSAADEANAAAPATPAPAPVGVTINTVPILTYDRLVMMSPFEVLASGRDIGYFTQNTTMGTRLNSNLGDLGASITVISKQQMTDTASVNLNDLFLYEASTEGTENYTSLGSFGKGTGVGDNIQASPQTSNRVRGLGSVDVSRDYFIANPAIQLDTYNVDDVELSRGPNSTLFGIGSPSGIVNEAIEKAVLNRDSSAIAARFGSYGDFRSTLNLNRTLVPDRLAVAVAGLYANAHPTAQEPAYDIQRREFAAITLKPFADTVIRANVEAYDNPNRRANSITPADEITPWLANGSPKWDPITYTATVNGATTAPITNSLLLPPGLVSGLGNSTTIGPQFYIVHGTAQLWEQAQLGTNFASVGTPTNAAGSVNGAGTNAAANLWGPIGFERLAYTGGNYAKFSSTSPAPGAQVTYPLFHEPGINNPQLLNYQGVNLLAPNLGEDRATIYSAEVQQQIAGNLFLEAGWYREQFTTIQHNYLGGNVGNAVMIDPNVRLLNGTPNPYFGRPFTVLQAPQDLANQDLNEQERLSLVYKLDFTAEEGWTRYLGRHTAQLFYQHRENDTNSWRSIQYVLDGHSWNSTTDIGAGGTGPSGSIGERYYLGDAGAAISYDDAAFVNTNFTFPLTWYNTQLNGGTWTNENTRLGPALYPVSTNRLQQQVSSYAGSVQDYFLNDRLVLTLGQRHDYERNRTTPTATIDPSTGLLDTDNLASFGNWVYADGITRQAGGVAHLTKWLSVHYNRSDNFTVAGLGEDQFGNVLPNPSGTGKDYGLSLSLCGDKLVAELNWYRSDAANSREGTTTFVDRALRIDYSFFAPWAQQVATNNLGAAASPSAINAYAQGIVQYPTGLAGLAAASQAEADTQSVQARGWEFNIIYNPSAAWTMKFTADQNRAVYNNVYPHVQAYLAARLPVWTAATDPVLGPFWTTVSAGNIAGLNSSPQQWLASTVDAAGLDAEITQQGHDSPDLSKYHFTYLTNYQFVGGALKGWGAGTALRYETPAAIGYLGGPPDPGALGAIDTLQAFNPVLGKEVLHQDLWLSYRTKLPFLDDRIMLTISLNCRDLWSNGSLLTVGINPDGSAQAFRIIPPRQWYLQTGFDF